ncbi:phosphotransferase [Nonomuraea sp. NPDC046802]|uniref:phosphotransferase n=1 Tax=Nonomuraea sp. NPDC046802 TaxID=3154919 RepID=UPI0033CC0CFB
MTDATCGVRHDLPLLQEAFGLGELDMKDLTYLPDGMMNRNWRLRTDRGTYALKQILDVPLDMARRNLRVQALLATAGIPACVPEVSVDGDVVIEAAGRGYCLLPWAQGTHLRGPTLSLEQVRRFGRLTARIHHRLNSFPPESGLAPVTVAPPAAVADSAAAVTEADRYLRLISSLEVRQPFDVTVAALLEQRKNLLAEYAGRRPASDSPAGPAGWTHGDLQYRNLLWRDGDIVAVLDWDRIQVRTLAEEITRTAMVQFTSQEGHLHLEHVAAFAAGYRHVIPLRSQEVADALDRLWWRRMTSFWQLDHHYNLGTHGAAELIVLTERLLAWWSEHREEVAAAFTMA